jgi:hypothetical protein
MPAKYTIIATKHHNAVCFEVFNTQEEANTSTLATTFASKYKTNAPKVFSYAENNIPPQHQPLLQHARTLHTEKLFDLTKCNIPEMAQELVDNGYTLIKMDETARQKLNEASREAHNILHGKAKDALFTDPSWSQDIDVLKEYAVSKNTIELVTAIVKQIEPSYSSQVRQDFGTSHFRHKTRAVSKHSDSAWALIVSAKLSDKNTKSTIIYIKDESGKEREKYAPDGYALLFTGGCKKNSDEKYRSIIDKINGGKGFEHRAGPDGIGNRTNLTQRYQI